MAIGAGLKGVKWNWRILCEYSSALSSLTAVGLGVVPSLLQLILFHWLPESPRVLALRGQDDRAREVLGRIYKFASPDVIDLKLQVIKSHLEATTRLERTMTLKERITRLWTNKSYRRSIFTVCSIQVFGQFTGYNTLLYYAGTLFGLLGLKNPAVGGLIPSITNTFFLLCGMVMVDRIGRRGLLMKFGPIMAVGLTWCLISFYCESSSPAVRPTLTNSHVQAHRRIPGGRLSVLSEARRPRDRRHRHLLCRLWINLRPPVLVPVRVPRT